jgi:SOS response associated peptidase (SRAP)
MFRALRGHSSDNENSKDSRARRRQRARNRSRSLSWRVQIRHQPLVDAATWLSASVRPHSLLVRTRKADASRSTPNARPSTNSGTPIASTLHRAGRRLLRVESNQRQPQAALCHRHEGRQPVWHRRAVGELEGSEFRPMDSHLCDITTDANQLVAEIHDRMPLIIALAGYQRWLGDEPNPHDLMRPFPAEPMWIWPISTRVNKPENDDLSTVEPIELSAT